MADGVTPDSSSPVMDVLEGAVDDMPAEGADRPQVPKSSPPHWLTLPCSTIVLLRSSTLLERIKGPDHRDSTHPHPNLLSLLRL